MRGHTIFQRDVLLQPFQLFVTKLLNCLPTIGSAVTELMVEVGSRRKKGLLSMKSQIDLIIAGYPSDEKVQNIVLSCVMIHVLKKQGLSVLIIAWMKSPLG